MAVPWVTFNYTEMCSGMPMVFTMRKFIEDPALISLLSSLNITFNFVVGAVVSYMSDRIWTRWGRRRPLLIVGWTGLAVTLLLLPLARNLWTLAALIVLYQFFQDVAKPYEPLYNEVIPPHQRGRAGIIRNLTQNLSAIFFNAVLIAQFDRDYGIDALGGGITITGETVLYWIGAAGTLLTVAFLVLKVRETPPARSIRRERFVPRQFLRDVFGHRQWWFVYLLYLCPILASGAGGGPSPFLPLFLAEQLHFTKAEIGWSSGAVMVLNLILFVPLSGLLADRVSRLRLFQVALIGQALAHFAFFLYARCLADFVVSLPVATAFLAANSAFVYLGYVLWGPLVYDYVPSERYGTVSAGFSFAGGLAGFLCLNASGLWVKGFTALFGRGGTGAMDYSSVFAFQLPAGLAALALARCFEREVKRSRIIAHGRLEFEEKQRLPG